MFELFFDCETENIIPKKVHPSTFEKYPRLVSIAWILRDDKNVYSQHYYIVKNDTEGTPIGASSIHGIDRKLVDTFGHPLEFILELFFRDVERCERIVCHNVQFDVQMVASELFRIGRGHQAEILLLCDSYCTMQTSTNLVKLPSKFGTSYKWPKLSELHVFLFGTNFSGAHNALDDTNALVKCYYELIKRL